ncbi:carboxylesterase 4A isoform X3 [Cervus elaphus]|uniref:carboxylesterase 4A isoform X3 n=1 Tax=Cervus elaphus TaxID=9860 RepID=UPI001CC27640|nr:carboxylesterase 4A isoform X3 [Cervus elaphus]
MNWILCLSLTLLLVAQTAWGALHTKEPLVDTKYGTLRGKQIHVGKTPINVFLGVPFSKPPVGARRFAAPESPEPWEGIRDATTYAPACLQESWGQVTSMYFNTHKRYKWLHFSEDCLYLNVHAPVRARGDPLQPVSTQPSTTHHPTQAPRCPAQDSALLAQVMIWFPGGAFLVGSASTYDGSELAAREKVVVVVLQHRLGILGFLSTGDSQARGNWALLDQVAALRWVQKNIEAFGGDPGCVTLFGQSSGAMCISGLMTSPLARGLFHRAISQSGTAALQIFITPDPLKVAKKIAQLAGCNHNSTKILVDCLRTLSGAEVMRVSQKMRFFKLRGQEDPQEIVWFMSPVVDGVVFQDNPIVVLIQGQVAPVPYLLGVNSLEFNWLLPFIVKFPMSHLRKETIIKLLWSTSTLLNVTKEQLPLVMEEYLSDVDDHDQKMLQKHVMDLAGDATFVYSTLQAARYHRNAGFPVYLYEFEHYAPGTIVKPRTDGADHGDEIGFIFGSPFSKGHSSSKEKALSLQMMKYWANFARSGNPNGGKLPYWPRYNKDEKYLQLDLTTRVGVMLREKKMAFWKRLHQN